MLITDSPANYIFIRAVIWSFRAIAPASLPYCFYRVIPLINGPRHPLRWLPLDMWMLGEATFYLLVYTPLRYKLQKEATHPEALSKDDRLILMSRCLDRVSDVEAYLSGWFLGAPIAEIKREDVREFYAWCLMDKQIGDTDPEEAAELDLHIGQLESRLGRSFEDGRGKASSLRLTLDGVPMQHHPLIWYAIVSAVECYSISRLWYNGFQFHRLSWFRCLAAFPVRPHTFLSTRTSASGAISYWHRKHTSKTKTPILFIHGIGIGLYAYVDFLIELNSKQDAFYDGDIGIIVVEITPISSRIGPEALSAAETKLEICEILAAHGWKEVVLVAHSYGTGIAANIIRDSSVSRYIKSAMLMDPICFMLHLPDVAFNFTRRKPTSASEYMLHYFSSQDMMISHTLARHLFWKEHILFKDDLPEDLPTTVTLSGQDIIVPTAAVWNHLTNRSGMTASAGDSKDVVEWQQGALKVLWFNNFNHADLFKSKGARRGIAAEIRTLCEEGRSTAV